MAIRIIVDGNTMNETTNINLQMLQSVTGEYIDDDVIEKAKALQPKVVEAAGYHYHKLPDGGYELVITDTAVRRANAFVATWAPAISAIVLRYRTEVKFLKKFAKKFIEANKKLVASLHDELKYDGLKPDDWVDKKAKEWGVTEDKRTKNLDDETEDLSKKVEKLYNDVVDNGKDIPLDEFKEICIKLGELKARVKKS